MLDYTIAFACLIFLFPLLIVLFVLVRLKLGAPVLFKQKRPGHKGQIFTFYKFRTMTSEKNENGELLPDEKRLTEFGQILRKYSLDELPQLLNVLKGELSLVGPRPLLPDYLDKYTPEQMRRHDVKPGITGLAQVNGRNSIGWEEKFKYDIQYVDNQSFFLDLKILLKTALILLKKNNDISALNHATMPKFEGKKKESK